VWHNIAREQPGRHAGSEERVGEEPRSDKRALCMTRGGHTVKGIADTFGQPPHHLPHLGDASHKRPPL
jgi:hypothetical protein